MPATLENRCLEEWGFLMPVLKGGRAFSTLAAAVLLFAGVVACGSSPAPSMSEPVVTNGSALSGAVPAELMKMPLTNEEGHTVRLADFRGKTIVLQDILTLCQEHCPIDTAAFVLAAHQYQTAAADPSKVVFLSITVDPARDIPAQLAAYRSLYVGPATNIRQWHLLTGTPTQLAQLWKFFHVYVQKVPDDPGTVIRNWRTGQRLGFDINHSDNVYFIDGTGQQRYVLSGQPYLSGATIPADLSKFMSADGHTNEKTGQWTWRDAVAVLAWITGKPA